MLLSPLAVVLHTDDANKANRDRNIVVIGVLGLTLTLAITTGCFFYCCLIVEAVVGKWRLLFPHRKKTKLVDEASSTSTTTFVETQVKRQKGLRVMMVF